MEADTLSNGTPTNRNGQLDWPLVLERVEAFVSSFSR